MVRRANRLMLNIPSSVDITANMKLRRWGHADV